MQMEREILESSGFLPENERVKVPFIRVEKAPYPVTVLCRVLEVSCSGWTRLGTGVDRRVHPELLRNPEKVFDPRLCQHVRVRTEASDGATGGMNEVFTKSGRVRPLIRTVKNLNFQIKGNNAKDTCNSIGSDCVDSSDGTCSDEQQSERSYDGN